MVETIAKLTEKGDYAQAEFLRLTEKCLNLCDERDRALEGQRIIGNERQMWRADRDLWQQRAECLQKELDTLIEKIGRPT
jgi:hypothetical protein